MAAKTLMLSLKSVWCHSNQANEHASDAAITITFDSQAHIIQAHKYWTKWETFDFALLARKPFTQENKSRAWSQFSAGQVFGKIQVLAKSRNLCKLSLFRFHCSACFIFLCFQACYIACQLKASVSFKPQW